jgi:aspartate aminotransferase
VPTPQVYDEAIIRLHRQGDSMALHGYSPSLGNEKVRRTVAESLNRRFDMDYETKHIFMTAGAASAIAHSLRAVTRPGDEVLTFAPYFPEYQPYVNHTGAVLKVVPANTQDFQINFAAFEEMLTDQVAAVLINTPNNPSGIVYTAQTLQTLSDIMEKKQKEYGHDIFLISDEPYREIVFDGLRAPYPSKFYDNTLSCYSFSKSLSVPGERIGYIAVSPRATDADILAVIFGQISRGIGHNCPSSSVQMAMAEAIDQTSDLSVYETNRNLLYDALTRLGFEVVKPGGTFYIFPKALEEDAAAFCLKAKKYDLILVPADNFGCPGYFRMAYCIDTEKVKRSIPILEKFVQEQYR